MSELISGKEALIALANGEEVQYYSEKDPSIQTRWTTIKHFADYGLDEFLNERTSFRFRLKTRTISINGIECPAPFEPKNGERYLYINNKSFFGFGCREYSEDDDDFYIQFGAWRTEEEIKQVVAALRSVFNKSN